jgi:catechol 2,3-dioxygenase-like lactoylglutathione lyase family enzyme
MSEVGVAVSQHGDLDFRHGAQRVHYVCLPVRDLAEAKQFWVDVLGGQPVADHPTSLRVADIIVDLVETNGGWTGSAAEYPHYGFRFRPEDMAPVRDQIRAFGIPTGEIWTRHQVEGLMYFRDPSGNLLEAACWHGLREADKLPLSRQLGGTYATDLTALSYTWKAPANNGPVRRVAPTQLDHLSLPARDLAATARFWVNVLGARLGRAPTHMVEIAGIDISFSSVGDGWPVGEVDCPRYAFAVVPEDIAPFKDRLESFGIPTSDTCTRNGRDACVDFCDPAGNLFELYCEDGFSGTTRPTITAGGDYRVTVSDLAYTSWNDPGQ